MAMSQEGRGHLHAAGDYDDGNDEVTYFAGFAAASTSPAYRSMIADTISIC